MYPACSPARKHTVAATSSGSANLPAGILLIFFHNIHLPSDCVQIRCYRIYCNPELCHLLCKCFRNSIYAGLRSSVGSLPGKGIVAETELMLIILPYLFCSIFFTAHLQQLYVPVRLTEITSFHFSLTASWQEALNALSLHNVHLHQSFPTEKMLRYITFLCCRNRKYLPEV